MTRNITIIVLLFVLVLPGIYIVQQLPVKKKYEGLRKDLGSPVLLERPIHMKETGFIGDVLDSWTVHTEECPDEVLTNVFELTKYDRSVQGLVSLYTHEIPPYSFVNAKRNQKESVIAATLNMITPITKDGCVYHAEGLAYLKLGDNIVEVYRDSKDGVKHTIYTKPKQDAEIQKQAEQVAAPDGE